MRQLRLSILSIFTGLALFSNAQDVSTIQVGSIAPGQDAPLMTVDGEQRDLKMYAGERGIIVIFSCNTCPFVVGNEEFAGWEKTYNSIYQRAKEMGIAVVLVNSNEAKRDNDDSADAMKKHAQDMGYLMPYLIDPNSALANLFGAKTTPHVFFFNEKFELVYVGSIDNSYDAKRKKDETYLMDALTAYQKGQAIINGTTPPRGCSIKRVKL